MSKKYYITTAIDYANGEPHLGHAYEKILADVISRYKRMEGKDVYFVTGLDEHGQKVQQSAQKRAISPQVLCDEMAIKFKEMCKKLDIKYDDYIRTTESRHKAVVTKILQDLYDQGVIYRGEYTGFYSTRQEQFLQEKDRDETGNWPEIFGEVVELTESNYFFKLSQYQNWLIEQIKSNPEFIYPTYRAKEVLEFLKEPLNDLCISRPKERLSWGIELPFDKNYVTYVWFDALLNYISVVEYGNSGFQEYWPADLHIIGKDILCPPHAVYWPIMLKACNIDIPKTLLAHGWWMVDGAKMSKSTGNVINPLEIADIFGSDAFRYFVMREMIIGQDGNFSKDLFLARYNSDLANDFGNLVSRFQNMVTRYTDSVIPHAHLVEQPESELQAVWDAAAKEIPTLGSNHHFNSYLERVFDFVKAINRYIDIRAPWKLSKSTLEVDRQRLETCLSYIAEGLRVVVVSLQPFMPNITLKVSAVLGIHIVPYFDNERGWMLNKLAGKNIGDKVILFPKIEL